MRQFFLISGLQFFLLGCHQETRVKLQENPGDTVVYYSSKRYGYRIEVSKGSNIQETNYIIQINTNGDVMIVYKYPAILNNESGISDNLAKQAQYLATDTSDTLLGAKFFYYDIIGYYGRYTNFIVDNHYRGTIAPVSEEEKLMFSRIDSLMKRRKLSYKPFTVLQTFWFKYYVEK